MPPFRARYLVSPARLAFWIEDEQRAASDRLRDVRGSGRSMDERAGRVVPDAVVEGAGDDEDFLGSGFVHVDPLPARSWVNLEHDGLRAPRSAPQRTSPDAGKQFLHRRVLHRRPLVAAHATPLWLPSSVARRTDNLAQRMRARRTD